ncbi:MAG: hypothetical protein QXZ44_02320 [Ferroplasma sp.]
MDENDNGVIGFKLDEEPKWIRVTLDDGTVLEIKTEIMSIMKVGNDPNTGLPQYNINAVPMMRMMHVDKSAIKKKDQGDRGLYR